MTDFQSTESGVAGRYASALFELARDESKLDEVEAGVNAVAAMIDGSEDLQRMMRSAVISAEDQQKAIAAVMAKAGISGYVASFVELAAKNRRIFAVPDMLKAFSVILARHRGETNAVVTSAEPLSDAALAALKTTLKDAMKKDVRIESRVDPSIIGGLIVRAGSRQIDSSLKTKLNSLKIALKEAG